MALRRIASKLTRAPAKSRKKKLRMDGRGRGELVVITHECVPGKASVLKAFEDLGTNVWPNLPVGTDPALRGAGRPSAERSNALRWWWMFVKGRQLKRTACDSFNPLNRF